MEDSEFDKLFADKMRSAGAPDLSDEDWGQLSPLLEAEQRRRWRAFPLWWLGALSGLLLCSNIGWWLQWRKSEKNTDALRTEWQQVRRERITLRDTDWTKVVVFQYDTVYRTLVYQPSPRNLAQHAGVILGQANNGRFIIGLGKGPDLGNSPTQPLSNMEHGIVAADSLSEKIEAGGITPIRLEMIPSKPVQYQAAARDINVPENEPVVIPPKRAHTPWRPLLIPRKFRIGAGMGYVIPRAESLVNNGGFSSYLASEFVFSEHLALTLEGAYRAVSFRGNVYDETLGLPSHASPGDDYVLEYFAPEEGGLKPILQLTTGMRYWFGAQHRLSPYLGLGYALQWDLPFELNLEYHNPVTDKEKEISVEVPFRSNPVSLLDLNAGLRYRFLRNLYWQTGGSYQFKIDAEQPGIPRFWEIKSSVLYGF